MLPSRPVRITHRMTQAHTPPTSSRRPLHIAVVDDDPQLRDLVLVPGLRDHGFVVTGMGSASELQTAMQVCLFDIIVLDLGLPDSDGLDLTARIRPASDIGIVMLTGRADDHSRIRGLTAGADCFLTKPVTIDVLAASLTSLARRLESGAPAAPATAATNPCWELAGSGWRLVTPDGERITLSRSERDVLIRLLATPGAPVIRETLIASLTDDVHSFDPHRLEMLIHRLRSKIARHWSGDNPLQAVRGRGYLFVADVSTATGVPATNPSVTPTTLSEAP